MKILKTNRSFKKEFRRQLRFAITAAIGFTVAFAWRNAIYDALYKLVQEITKVTQPIISDIYTALLITFLGILLIFLTSRILKEYERR